jgi:hypothetical protein
VNLDLKLVTNIFDGLFEAAETNRAPGARNI